MTRLFRICALAPVLLLATAMPAATPRLRRGPTSTRLSRSRAAATKSRSSSLSISPERATQIQSALVKSGYLSGLPSGTWDAQTQAAMEKMQADNGWQTKLVPDSRAIIKLGLGSGSSPAVAHVATPRDEPPPTVQSDAPPQAASNR